MNSGLLLDFLQELAYFFRPQQKYMDTRLLKVIFPNYKRKIISLYKSLISSVNGDVQKAISTRGYMFIQNV